MNFSTSPQSLALDSQIDEQFQKDKLITVFCDFDGTISVKDIGDDFFNSYGSIQPHNSLFKEGKIDIYTYWKRVIDTLPNDLSEDDISEYCSNIEIDPYFKKFISLLESAGVEPIILSDGFDIYINRVLEREGLSHLKVYSNSIINAGNKKEARFPYSKDGCNCPSAVCKRAVQCLHSSANAISVYIGDGLSDYCPAESSDIIFAKKKLAKWCNSNSVPHYPYKSFYQVIRIFREKILQGNIKSRNRAQVLRNNFVKYE